MRSLQSRIGNSVTDGAYEGGRGCVEDQPQRVESASGLESFVRLWCGGVLRLVFDTVALRPRFGMK